MPAASEIASLRLSFPDGRAVRLAETTPEEVWWRAFERRAFEWRAFEWRAFERRAFERRG
jgi:hypothetical protein